MNSQMNLFESEQDSNPSIAYRGASLASRTALQESVKRLVMSVIYGRKCGESFAKLSRDGLWLKMSGDYCQAKMDGSFEEYSEILPTWGLMLDGVLIELPMSERFTPESGLRLLPTPTAGDAEAWTKKTKIDTKTSIWKTWKNKHTDRPINHFMWNGLSASQSAEIYETIMAFPKHWAKLKPTETQ